MFAQFLQHVLHALLKLPAVHRTGHEHSQVKRYDASVLQLGYIRADEALGQSLNDG